MSTFGKKITSIALTATTGVWMSGALLLVPVAANAQSVSELQAQINALLAQINQLTAQLQTSQGGGGSSMTSVTFTRNLTVGSRGEEVSALQQVLIDKGYLNIDAPTGYFGKLTKAAVAAWQEASGISPTLGYFGPKSRAALNAMMSTTPPPGPPGPPGPGTPPPAPAGTSASFSLASDNPASGALISSSGSAAARVPVLAVNVTAGLGSAINISAINFKKTGVISDSSISGAYLIDAGGKVIAQYNSISSGVIQFSGLVWSIPAGQTQKVWLAIDPASGLSSGNTVGFALMSADAVTTTDASGNALTEGGNFPLQGNTFTVTSVTNPSLATLTVASSSIGTRVTAGSQNVLVGAFNFSVTNSKVWLKGVNFRVIGSANKTDLKNAKLMVNGVQVGSTLASVASDGSAYFDGSVTPGILNTGSNNVQIYADVMGSPSYNFQFEVLNSYDILAVDSQYNVPISAQSNVGTQVSIDQGTITVTQASDTPTGNIAKGQSGVTLAKFAIYAAGEPVRVKWLGFSLVFTGAAATLDSQVRNVGLIDDAGNQVGSTINLMSAAVTCTDSAQTTVTSTATNCFGNNSSPVNYVVPANTTRVLSLRADVQSTADFTTLTGKLTGNTSNLQGLTSSQINSSGAATGSSLNLAANSLTVAKNTAVGTQSFAAGALARKIGSYALTASSAEGVKVNSITVTTGAAGASFQNLKVMVGGTQFGTTQGVLGASSGYTFSGTAFTVPQGQTTYVDVYADILNSATAGTKTTITTLSGCSASGANSFTAISCTSTAGQDVLVTGQATVQIALDSASQAAAQLVMGSTGNSIATFRFTETSNVEDVKITNLNIFQQVATTSSVKSAFSNVALYKTDGTLLATAGAANTAASSSNPGSGYYYKFNFAQPIIVPQNNSVSAVLKGDVASYSSSGATDNTTHVFKIATSTDSDNNTLAATVVALGSTSNATSAVSLSSPNANTQTVLRSKLTVTATALGASTSRAKQAVDDLATLNFTADSAGSVTLNTVVVSFSGSAPSIATFLDNLNLYDSSTGSNLGTSNTTSSACSGANTCTKTFSNIAYTVSAGTTKGFNVRVDSTKTQAGTSGISQTLTTTIAAAGNVSYTDGLDSSAVSNLNLPSSVIPIQVNAVTYAQGT